MGPAAAAQTAAVLKSRRPPRQIAALAYVAFRFIQRPDGTTQGKLSMKTLQELLDLRFGDIGAVPETLAANEAFRRLAGRGVDRR